MADSRLTSHSEWSMAFCGMEDDNNNNNGSGSSSRSNSPNNINAPTFFPASWANEVGRLRKPRGSDAAELSEGQSCMEPVCSPSPQCAEESRVPSAAPVNGGTSGSATLTPRVAFQSDAAQTAASGSPPQSAASSLRLLGSSTAAVVSGGVLNDAPPALRRYLDGLRGSTDRGSANETLLSDALEDDNSFMHILCTRDAAATGPADSQRSHVRVPRSLSSPAAAAQPEGLPSPCCGSLVDPLLSLSLPEDDADDGAVQSLCSLVKVADQPAAQLHDGFSASSPSPGLVKALPIDRRRDGRDGVAQNAHNDYAEEATQTPDHEASCGHKPGSGLQRRQGRCLSVVLLPSSRSDLRFAAEDAAAYTRCAPPSLANVRVSRRQEYRDWFASRHDDSDGRSAACKQVSKPYAGRHHSPASSPTVVLRSCPVTRRSPGLSVPPGSCCGSSEGSFPPGSEVSAALYEAARGTEHAGAPMPHGPLGSASVSRTADDSLLSLVMRSVTRETEVPYPGTSLSEADAPTAPVAARTETERGDERAGASQPALRGTNATAADAAAAAMQAKTKKKKHAGAIFACDRRTAWKAEGCYDPAIDASLTAGAEASESVRTASLSSQLFDDRTPFSPCLARPPTWSESSSMFASMRTGGSRVWRNGDCGTGSSGMYTNSPVVSMPPMARRRAYSQAGSPHASGESIRSRASSSLLFCVASCTRASVDEGPRSPLSPLRQLRRSATAATSVLEDLHGDADAPVAVLRNPPANKLTMPS